MLNFSMSHKLKDSVFNGNSGVEKFKSPQELLTIDMGNSIELLSNCALDSEQKNKAGQMAGIEVATFLKCPQKNVAITPAVLIAYNRLKSGDLS